MIEAEEGTLKRIQATLDVLIEVAASEGRNLSSAGRTEDKKALIERLILSRLAKLQAEAR